MPLLEPPPTLIERLKIIQEKSNQYIVSHENDGAYTTTTMMLKNEFIPAGKQAPANRFLISS